MSKHEVVIGFLEDDADQADLISLWLQQAGYTPRAVWVDPQRLFSVHWLALPA